MIDLSVLHAYVMHPASFTSYFVMLHVCNRGSGGTVVTHSPPPPEGDGSNPAPYVGKLAVAYQWLEFYSTEP